MGSGAVDDILVLFALQRACRVDEDAAGLEVLEPAVEDCELLLAEFFDIVSG